MTSAASDAVRRVGAPPLRFKEFRTQISQPLAKEFECGRWIASRAGAAWTEATENGGWRRVTIVAFPASNVVLLVNAKPSGLKHLGADVGKVSPEPRLGSYG